VNGVAGAFLAALASSSAWAGAYPSPEVGCPPRDDGAKVQRFDSLEAMPEPIWRGIARVLEPEEPANSLPSALPDIVAPRDAEWQSSDMIKPGKPLAWRRFIRGFSVETRPYAQVSRKWYVWLEHGGQARTLSVAIFDGSSEIKPIALFRGHEDSLCAIQAAYQNTRFLVYKL
jgi:hypothetical protein